MHSTLKSWPILRFLPPDLADEVVQALVFGETGNEALVAIASGDVYALGFNQNGCLGIGNTSSTYEPRKVDVLCRKGLVDIAYSSGPSILVLTDNGDLYVWGYNAFGALGYDTRGATQQLAPTLISLSNKKVVQVACGSVHSLALTADGEVYGWGANGHRQVGVPSGDPIYSPTQVTGILQSKKVLYISCGQCFAVAVTDEGELYSWGHNLHGQLGIGIQTAQPGPIKVQISSSIFFKKALCGTQHVLAISDVGDLYSWGENSCGQVGIGTTAQVSVPTQITAVDERWKDIAAHHLNNMSAAETITGKIFMWGRCRSLNLLSPFQATVESLDDVFACFGMPQVMFRPVKPGTKANLTVKESVRKSFDDKKTSDLTFVVGGEPIYAHRTILKIRCEYFPSLLRTHWRENSKSEIEITDFTYTVFKAFLQFFYTDEVDLPLKDAIGLLSLAKVYDDERLKRKCGVLIKQYITVENSAMLLGAALEYNAKDLEEFCFQFITSHLTSVSQTKSFKELDAETVKILVIEAGKAGAFKT